MQIINLDSPEITESEISRSNLLDANSIYVQMDSWRHFDAANRSTLRKRGAKLDALAPKCAALVHPSNGYRYYADVKLTDWSQMARQDPNIPDPPTTEPSYIETLGARLLVVSGIGDPITPNSWAKSTASTLHAPLINADVDTHGVAAEYSNQCLNDTLVRFFDSAPGTVKSATCKANN
jgi:hypothetical protein